MPMQRKPDPRVSAYRAEGLPSMAVETDRRIPLIVLAVIAAIMAIVLVFTRCSAPTPQPQSSLPDVGEPAIVEASSSAAVVAEVEEPENPAAKATLAEYTWEELSQISEKIAAAATEADALYVAQQYRLVDANGKLDANATKPLDLSDGTAAAVRIIGFNHDNVSDGSGKAGITFMFADAVGTMAYSAEGDTSGGWPSSNISYYLGVEFWDMLPEDLTTRIKEVTKSTNTASADSISETGDIMWLPSYVEVAGAPDAAAAGASSTLQQEGSQYKLFSDSGVVASSNNSVLVMHDGGSASAWWLRSADVENEGSYCYVNAAGKPSNAAPANQEYLLVPAFCL